MLSFEVVGAGDTVQIWCDDDGLDALLACLVSLKERGREHVHLRAPAAGGSELDAETPWGKRAVAEVILSNA